MTARRTRVKLPSGTVSLLEWDAARTPAMTVLLLHGGGADSAELSWGEVGPALAEAGYRVIAPDHPGFGRSPHAGVPLSQDLLVRYVGELVDELALDPYVVAGLSLGGGVTLGHLLDRPGRARGTVLLGCYGIMPRLADGPFGALTHFTSFLMLRTGLLSAATRSYVRNRGAMERGLRGLVRTAESRTPELIEAVVEEAATGTGIATFAEWQTEQVLRSRLRTVYTDRLSSISTPVLVVHGEQDSGVPITRAEAAARMLPDAELLRVPGAGHWVQRDRPDLVIPAMIDHVRTVENA